MELHTAKSKLKQFYRIGTKSSSWKIPNTTIAIFQTYIGRVFPQLSVEGVTMTPFI